MKKLFLAFVCLQIISPAIAQLYTSEVQVINGLGSKVGIGISNPYAAFDVGNLSGNGTLTAALGRLGEGHGTGDGTYLGVRSFTTQPIDVKGFAIEHGFYGYINNSINFFRGDSYTGGFITINTNNNTEQLRITSIGNVGIGITTPSQKLSVNGNASKATAGDWLANSDARLKTNISPLHTQETLQKMLQLQGITYEWSDDKTGLDRPKGIQYGFTAQNIQEVFPSLVVEDDKGYLQSSYSTYDAMLVESIRALNEKIERLERENGELKTQNEGLKTQVIAADARIHAELQAIKQQLLKLGGQNGILPAVTQE